MSPGYSRIEEEVIILRAITDLVDSMVNFEIFRLVGTSPDANILFHTTSHQRLFYILLVDLLSKADEGLFGRDISYLDALSGICKEPCFDESDSVAHLGAAVDSFIDWLGFEPTIDVWLPSVDAEVELTLPRSTFIRMCGNISKHSILRQSRPAKHLAELLKRAGVSVTLDAAVLALEEFFERFHSDVLNYHSSRIAELLNEVQWGVYHYLRPEYVRSYEKHGTDPWNYRFHYPDDVTTDLARTLYWDLMNWVRGGPIIEKFTVTKSLKMRY